MDTYRIYRMNSDNFIDMCADYIEVTEGFLSFYGKNKRFITAFNVSSISQFTRVDNETPS